MKINIAVLASGRGTNFQALLNKSQEKDSPFKIRILISDKKDAKALQIAEDSGVHACYINPKDFKDKAAFEEFMVETIKSSGCDLVCLAGYMRILGKTFLSQWGKDIINIHPSLLPSFPGLDAQKQTVEFGVKYSGCTVHFVDEGMDTGPIIDQRVVPVYHTDDEDSLSERILIEEHKLYPEVVELYAKGKISKKGRIVIINR